MSLGAKKALLDFLVPNTYHITSLEYLLQPLALPSQAGIASGICRAASAIVEGQVQKDQIEKAQQVVTCQ